MSLKKIITDRRSFLSTATYGLGMFFALPLSASETPDQKQVCPTNLKREGLAYERIEYSLEAFVEMDDTKEISFILDESVNNAFLNMAFQKIKESKEHAGMGYDKIEDMQFENADETKKIINRYRSVWRTLGEYSELLKSRSKGAPDDFATELMYYRVIEDLRVHTNGIMALTNKAEEKNIPIGYNIETLKKFYAFMFGDDRVYQTKLDYIKCKIAERLKVMPECDPEDPLVSKATKIAEKLCGKRQ